MNVIAGWLNPGSRALLAAAILSLLASCASSTHFFVKPAQACLPIDDSLTRDPGPLPSLRGSITDSGPSSAPGETTASGGS